MLAAEASTGRRWGEGATTAVPLRASEQAEREGTHDPRSHQIAYSLPHPSCSIDCDILHARRQVSRSNPHLVLEVELHHLHMAPSQFLLLIDGPVALQHPFGQGAKCAPSIASPPPPRWRILPPVQFPAPPSPWRTPPDCRPISFPTSKQGNATGQKTPRSSLPAAAPTRHALLSAPSVIWLRMRRLDPP